MKRRLVNRAVFVVFAFRAQVLDFMVEIRANVAQMQQICVYIPI